MTTSTLALTPHGRLTVVSVPDDPPLPFELAKQLVMDSVLGSGQVLLRLGAEHVGAALPPVIAWWRDLAVRYLTALCTLPEVAEHLPGRVPSPDAGELQALAWSAPPMDGAEYLSVGVLERLWQELDAALHAELQASGQPLGVFLKALNPAWNLVGRVHFNLAENRHDEQCPSPSSPPTPPGCRRRRRRSTCRWARRCANTPARPTSESCCRCCCRCSAPPRPAPGCRTVLDAGEIFHPLRWTPARRCRFLHDVPELERAGVVVRMPPRGAPPPAAAAGDRHRRRRASRRRSAWRRCSTSGWR